MVPLSGGRGRRDPEIHWSHDCTLLQCCVDERGLEYCYECEEFICHKLEKWAADYPHHRRALDWLKEMHGKRET